MVTDPTDSGASDIAATFAFNRRPVPPRHPPVTKLNVVNRKSNLVSSKKSASAHAVTLDRWESLKREYFWRTHRDAPAVVEEPTVADPNAE
jgi:hypothetical protein